MPILNRQLRVMHIISGDLWAGAESQAFTLLKHLHKDTALHVVVMNEGELLHRIEGLNIPVTLVSETHLNSIQIFVKLIQIIRAFAPDVLHTHRQKENIFGNFANLIAAMPFKKRARSVRTSHGAPEFAPKGRQKIQVWLDNWVGKYLQQAVISVSGELATTLSKTFSPDKIHVIHNGVDRDALRAEIKIADFRQQAPDSLHLGIIGRIEPVKRIDIFIEMAALLSKDNRFSQPLEFHVIGNGSLGSAMETKAKNLGLGDHVHFHGYRTDMASCISSLDIVMMCSDHEGTPMTALEALALGTKLIAHAVGGLKEILNEYPSLLVSDHSPLGYKNCIANSILNPTLSIELPKNYSAEKNVADTLRLYNQLTTK